MKEIAIITEANTRLTLEPELAEAVRNVIGAAESENTRRAYKAQTDKFKTWCKRRSTSALPVTPAVVATYLVDLATTGADPSKPPKGAKVATVGLALSAISAAHRAADLELDTRSCEIRMAMKGVRKTYAAPQAQAEPLKPAMVRGILDKLDNSPLDRRDACPHCAAGRRGAAALGDRRSRLRRGWFWRRVSDCQQQGGGDRAPALEGANGADDRTGAAGQQSRAHRSFRALDRSCQHRRGRAAISLCPKGWSHWRTS